MLRNYTVSGGGAQQLLNDGLAWGLVRLLGRGRGRRGSGVLLLAVGTFSRLFAHRNLAPESSLVDEGRTPNVARQRLGGRCYLWREVRRQRMVGLEVQHPHVYKTLADTSS